MIQRAIRDIIRKLRQPHPWLMMLTFVAYSIFICWLEARHHVFWRDEVRALSIAKHADSFSDLLILLRNEGHPVGWYVLLKTAYLIFHGNWVLPFVSLSIAIISAFIWLQYAPFPLFERVLFLAGVFPLYDFSVLARNYGISMLLMFVTCSQFSKRFTKPVHVYLPLFFLSFTNAHSLIIAGIVTTALVFELLLRRTKHWVEYVPAGLVFLDPLGWLGFFARIRLRRLSSIRLGSI